MPTTKEIKKLAKMGQKARARLYLHVEADASRESWSDAAHFFLTCAIDADGKKGTTTKKTELEGMPGVIRNGSTSVTEIHKSGSGRPFLVYAEAYRPTSGYWSLYAVETFLSVMELVPNDAKIAFEVYLDGGTTEGLIEAKMHSDHLYLVVTRMVRGEEVRRRFLLDVSTGEHNTARFGFKIKV